MMSLDAYFYQRESKLRQVLVEGVLCTHFRRQVPPQTGNRNIPLPQATALCLCQLGQIWRQNYEQLTIAWSHADALQLSASWFQHIPYGCTHKYTAYNL